MVQKMGKAQNKGLKKPSETDTEMNKLLLHATEQQFVVQTGQDAHAKLPKVDGFNNAGLQQHCRIAAYTRVAKTASALAALASVSFQKQQAAHLSSMPRASLLPPLSVG